MTKKIGNIRFNKLTVDSAKQKVIDIIDNATRCHQGIVANSYSLVLAHKDPEFTDICESADIVFADGLPVIWASKFLGDRIPERIAGPDFMWTFSEVCAQKKYNVFLLGSEETYLTQLKVNLEKNFPGIAIVGTYAPPYANWSIEENEKIIAMINITEADLVWVGVSTPKQDKWIAEYKSKLKAKVAIGVGAAFDFHSGKIERAPYWMRKFGLEWLHRLSQDPKRLWKRYLIGNMQFVWIVVKEIANFRINKILKK